MDKPLREQLCGYEAREGGGYFESGILWRRREPARLGPRSSYTMFRAREVGLCPTGVKTYCPYYRGHTIVPETVRAACADEVDGAGAGKSVSQTGVSEGDAEPPEPVRPALTRGSRTTSLAASVVQSDPDGQSRAGHSRGMAVAESPSSRKLLALLKRVAPTRATVLIEGESGTGKELVARLLHRWSERVNRPFVAVNCKAFAEGVLESELFGHERGAFTGAIGARAGCFERASGGTLFLDEIGEISPAFQAKLLRVLEDGEVLRVGSERPRKVDVRVVTATNRSLRQEVAAGRFREDLFFRLNVIPIQLQPLRERREDILPLAHYFLSIHAAELGRPLKFTPRAEEAMLSHSWPGNVRELENVVERAVVLTAGDSISAEDLTLNHGSESEPESSDGTLHDYLNHATAVRIRAALEAARGNRAFAAQLLGVDRATLYRMMKRLNV